MARKRAGETDAEFQKRLKQENKPEGIAIDIKQREKRRKELIEQGQSERQSREQATKEQRLGLTPKKEEEIKSQQQEVRRGVFQEQTGSGQLRQELQQNISNPPNVQTEPVATKTWSFFKNILGTATGSRKVIDVKGEEAQLQGGVPPLIAPVTATLSLPAISKLATNSKIGQAVIGASATTKLIAGGIFTAIVGPKLVDFNRGKISVLQSSIDSMKSQSSTVQSAVQNGGLSPQQAIARLREMSDSINEAEKAIKALSVYNFNFRYSEEYRKVQQSILDARENIIERVGGVENLAAMGQTTLNPEGLIIDISTLKE